MKGTRHSEEQIIAILKQGEAGLATADLCRQHGISEQTYYRWKAKYGGMGPETPKTEATRRSEPKAEARGSGPDVGQPCAERRVVQKLVVPVGLRAAASYVMSDYQTSERHACRLLGLARSTQRYRGRRGERDAALRARLKDLAGKRMRFGYRRLTVMLVREGVEVNHKRVYRLYREEGLAMRIRQRRRIR